MSARSFWFLWKAVASSLLYTVYHWCAQSWESGTCIMQGVSLKVQPLQGLSHELTAGYRSIVHSRLCKAKRIKEAQIKVVFVLHIYELVGLGLLPCTQSKLAPFWNTHSYTPTPGPPTSWAHREYDNNLELFLRLLFFALLSVSTFLQRNAHILLWNTFPSFSY
jgi:hypothetical protein